MMLDVLSDYAILCLTMVVAGFATVKITFWGSAAMLSVSGVYLMLPDKSPSTVIDTLWPHIVDLWLIYPRLIKMMIGAGWEQHGVMGVIIYSLVVIMPIIPYISGLILGFLLWPGFLLLKIIL